MDSEREDDNDGPLRNASRGGSGRLDWLGEPHGRNKVRRDFVGRREQPRRIVRVRHNLEAIDHCSRKKQRLSAEG